MFFHDIFGERHAVHFNATLKAQFSLHLQIFVISIELNYFKNSLLWLSFRMEGVDVGENLTKDSCFLSIYVILTSL